MKTLLTLIALTISFSASGAWRWTPWIEGATFSQARMGAYNYAVLECVDEQLEHNQSTHFQDDEGIDPGTGGWVYSSRHWFDCRQPQGWQVPCDQYGTGQHCGEGEHCVRNIAASLAISDAEAYCDQWGLDFDFNPASTKFRGINTPSCAKEQHEGHEWMGKRDFVEVDGTCK